MLYVPILISQLGLSLFSWLFPLTTTHSVISLRLPLYTQPLCDGQYTAPYWGATHGQHVTQCVNTQGAYNGSYVYWSVGVCVREYSGLIKECLCVFNTIQLLQSIGANTRVLFTQLRVCILMFCLSLILLPPGYPIATSTHTLAGN